MNWQSCLSVFMGALYVPEAILHTALGAIRYFIRTTFKAGHRAHSFVQFVKQCSVLTLSF